MSLLNLPRSVLLTASVLACTLSTSALAETVRLNFGVYSSNKPSAMVKVYRPILQELEESMSAKLNKDVDIRMQIAKDYDQGISHLVTGRVDFSAFGPASYVEAKRMNNDISILTVEQSKNSKVFYGIIAVAKDSPITSIAQLKGKSFAFGDEGSTIGRFLSQLELEQAGIRAGDLYRYEYLGRHDKVGTAVGAGSFDAGALNEKTFKKLVEAGENIRELVRFPNVTKPWIARSGLDEDVLNALRESLLQVRNPKTLASLKIDGFLGGGDDDYKVIRKAMENNHVFFADREVSSDVEQAAVSSMEPSAEPAIKAAKATATEATDYSVSTGLNTALSQQQAESVRLSRANGLEGQFVTINISLPRELFNGEAGSASNAITINLTIPSILPDAESDTVSAD